MCLLSHSSLVYGGINQYGSVTSNALVNGDTNTCSNCCFTEGPAELVRKVVDQKVKEIVDHKEQ